jgi:hypothetical protein
VKTWGGTGRSLGLGLKGPRDNGACEVDTYSQGCGGVLEEDGVAPACGDTRQEGRIGSCGLRGPCRVPVAHVITWEAHGTAALGEFQGVRFVPTHGVHLRCLAHPGGLVSTGGNIYLGFGFSHTLSSLYLDYNRTVSTCTGPVHSLRSSGP